MPRASSLAISRPIFFRLSKHMRLRTSLYPFLIGLIHFEEIVRAIIFRSLCSKSYDRPDWYSKRDDWSLGARSPEVIVPFFGFENYLFYRSLSCKVDSFITIYSFSKSYPISYLSVCDSSSTVTF